MSFMHTAEWDGFIVWSCRHCAASLWHLITEIMYLEAMLLEKMCPTY